MNNRYPAANLDLPEFARHAFSEIGTEKSEFDQNTPLKVLADAFEAEVPVSDLKQMMTVLWDFFNTRTITRRRDPLVLLALAWLSVTFRNAFSTFCLMDEGLIDASPSTTRVALEHSVYISLFASSDDRHRIAERMESLHVKYLSDIFQAASSPESLEEFLLIVLESSTPTGVNPELSWSAKMEQVCRQLQSGDTVYIRYRLLSRMMHGGMSSAEPYLFQLINDDDQFNFIPSVNPSNEMSLMSVASCVWAGWAIDEILGEPIFSEVLEPIADQLNLSPLFAKTSDLTRDDS